MKPIKNRYWSALSKKYEQLSLRERWMVFIAALVVVYAAISMLLIQPQLNHKKKWLAENESKQLEIQKLRRQFNAYQEQLAIDPDAQNKLRIQQLQDSVRVMDAEFQTIEKTLLTPEQIPGLLRDLLKENTRLKLIALKSLPPENLLSKMQLDLNLANQTISLLPAESGDTKDATAAGSEHPVMFGHGVEITVEGRYLDLLDYVASLERLHKNLLWDKASLVVEHYPVSKLKLTVSTVSFNKTWLSI